MFKILIMGLICLQSMLTPLSAQESEKTKEKIKERLQAFERAVNEGKADDLSSFWTQDAEFSRPVTGELLDGKDKIIPFLQKITREIKDRHLKFSFKPEKIDLPDANTATVQGISEITDKGKLLQRNARRVDLVKENGQWFIDGVDEIEVPPAPQFYNYLKQLEWLVGKWIDSDEDVSITFTTKWDKFKNFIFQNFKLEVYGLDEFEGVQIIGWDPIEKKFRSWIYDSDGGFGTGLWSKKGDSWYATIEYVLSDGKKGSATNIYTKVNDKSYTFSSVDRKAGGEALPNVEPVTVVKEE